jgi:hypothetical protein
MLVAVHLGHGHDTARIIVKRDALSVRYVHRMLAAFWEVVVSLGRVTLLYRPKWGTRDSFQQIRAVFFFRSRLTLPGG